MKKVNKEENPKKELRKLARRAKEAFENGYFLETSWLLATILETRVKKVLAKVEPQRAVLYNTFEQDIKRLKFLRLSSGNIMLEQSFTVEVIDELRTWKNQRNEMMKDMLVRHITEDRLERLANDGMKVLDHITEAGKNLKKEFAKAEE